MLFRSDTFFEKYGKNTILICRLLPFVSFDIVSYAAGLTSVSYTHLGIYPAVDPLDPTSRILSPETVGEEHYQVARSVQRVLQRYKELQDIIAIMGYLVTVLRTQILAEAQGLRVEPCLLQFYKDDAVFEPLALSILLPHGGCKVNAEH